MTEVSLNKTVHQSQYGPHPLSRPPMVCGNHPARIRMTEPIDFETAAVMNAPSSRGETGSGAPLRPSWSYGGELRLDDSTPRTLTDSLEAAAKHDNGIWFMRRDGSERFCRYAELRQIAAHIGGGLALFGIKPGDAVLLQCDTPESFLTAFWACQWAGAIPSPVAVAQTYERPNSVLDRLAKAWQVLGQPVVLTTQNLFEPLQRWKQWSGNGGVRLLTLENLTDGSPLAAPLERAPEDIALIMLTSGSTGIPKGVGLTHRNLICRSAASRQMNGFRASDVALNWMPLDHVAGLIYFHLRDVFLACREIQIPTSMILENPLRWLEAIERHRVTITFAPNFAFGLINERAEDIARRHWDLRSLRWLLNGAEPIVARTARRFLQLLVPHGLRPDAMHPAWGMSETASGVTYSDRFNLESTRDEDPFVEVGLPIPGFAMRIVDQNDCVVPEGTIGRLQVSGLTVMQGYLGQEEANREAFTPDGWFKTGDLGLLRDGRLTITGREKEVIIINSVNYYSHEIESAVEQLSGIQSSFTAACAVRDGKGDTDRLAVFFSPADWNPDRIRELVRSIRCRVLQKAGLNPDYLVPLPAEQIPKTEIGKIRRAELKRRFESGEFADICQRSRTLSPARREPRSALEHQLHAIWSAVLGVEMGLDESFFELGGNSLLATQILSRVREQFQVDLPFPTLFEENSTIAGMARSIESRRGERKPPFQIPKARPDEPLPLSFAQERLWFLDQLHPHSGLYHVRVALHLQGSPNVQALSKSLQYLAQRHEIFRTRFKVRAGRPVQVILPTDTISLETVAGNGAAGSDLHECLQQITLPSRHPLDLEHGPLWKAQWFSLQEQHHLLVLIFHQMAIDGWSLGLVLDELAQVYSAIEGQREPELKPLPIQGADFAVWQRQQPASGEALAFWQHELRAPWPKGRLRSNNTSAVPCAGPAITLIHRVERDLVESIRGLCQQESLTPFMIFLGAFAATLEPFLTENELIIGTPIAGRHHVETERMVGFLVNTLALRLAIDSNKTVHAWLRQIRQTVLNAFQHAEAPFEKVIETVNPKRDGSNPLIRFWIGSIDLPDALSAGALKMLAEPLPNSHAQFDLSLFIHSHPAEWKVVFEGNSDVIDRAGLERFQRLFCALLRRLTLDPEKTISTLLRESAEAADAGPSNAPSAITS